MNTIKIYIYALSTTQKFLIHKMMWENWLDLGFPKHLIELINGLYKDQEAAVRTSVVVTTWFPVEQGVRQD